MFNPISLGSRYPPAALLGMRYLLQKVALHLYNVIYLPILTSLLRNKVNYSTNYNKYKKFWLNKIIE